MTKYAVFFSIAYLLLTALCAALVTAVDIGGNAGMGLNIAVTIGSSFLAASRFVADHERLPSAPEKGAYALGALIGAMLASLLLVVAILGMLISPRELIWLLSLIESPKVIALIVGSTLFSWVVYYFAIRWSFSWYAKRAYSA